MVTLINIEIDISTFDTQWLIKKKKNVCAELSLNINSLINMERNILPQTYVYALSILQLAILASVQMTMPINADLLPQIRVKTHCYTRENKNQIVMLTCSLLLVKP